MFISKSWGWHVPPVPPGSYVSGSRMLGPLGTEKLFGGVWKSRWPDSNTLLKLSKKLFFLETKKTAKSTKYPHDCASLFAKSFHFSLFHYFVISLFGFFAISFFRRIPLALQTGAYRRRKISSHVYLSRYYAIVRND